MRNIYIHLKKRFTFKVVNFLFEWITELLTYPKNSQPLEFGWMFFKLQLAYVSNIRRFEGVNPATMENRSKLLCQ